MTDKDTALKITLAIAAMGTEELERTLKLLERKERYEFCEIVNNEINRRNKNAQTKRLGDSCDFK